MPSIHRSRDRVHSVSTAMCAFPIHGAGSPSASPLAVPEALASETIPHGPRLRRTPAPWERWRARRRESEASVPPFLEAVWRGVEGRTVRRGTAGCPLDHGSPCPAFPHALVGQADHPRRRVVHHDDAVVRSWAYPYTTLLGGMRGWIPRDRLSRPLHNVEGQSQSWGVCLHPGIEERGMAPLPPPSYHRPCGLDPSSLALQPFRGNGSQRPLERGLSRKNFRLNGCWAPAARGEKPLRTLPRSGGSAPPGRVSRQDREPHRTRDGAPPTRAGVPRRGMRPCQGAPAGRASDAGRPADARSQAMRPPRPARTWEGGPPPSGRVASPCRGRGGSAQRARPGAAPPRCAWGGPRAWGPGVRGPRGALLAGRGGWREAEGCAAVSGQVAGPEA